MSLNPNSKPSKNDIKMKWNDGKLVDSFEMKA